MPIIKRGDIWHYRKQIHKDIRSHMPDPYKGKTEIHRSLGAISKRDAKDAAEAYDEYFNAIINDCYATIGRGKQTARDAIFRRLNAERGITDEHKTSPAPEPEPQQATIYKEQSKPIRARYSIKRAYDLYLDDTKPVETTVNHWNSSWRRQRDKFGIHAKTKVFHSFRHTFKTLCLYANIPTISHDRLTGHAKSSVGDDYQHTTIPYLKKKMDEIDFGVTL